MNVLITAGNAATPIDRVRCITNIFSGRTGASIALEAYRREHRVTLLTSHPEVVREMGLTETLAEGRWKCLRYQSFEDLAGSMEVQITSGGFDAVVHCAAVSDYRVDGVFPSPGGERIETSGKLRSDEPELWLKLVRTPKLVDKIRRDWSFRGLLVKFKLEVDKSDAELLDIAERSRLHSEADLMVANTLEEMHGTAWVGAGEYRKTPRRELARSVLDAIEQSRKP